MHVTPNAPRRGRALLTGALVIAALLASVAPRDAAAMTVLYADLPELVRASSLVLHGKVVDTQVVDRRKEGRGVWTEFTLSVIDVWKGDRKQVGPLFKWRHIGGTTPDGLTLHVPGMPTFRPGEETVVLLESHSQGHVVAGATQGKFLVHKDKQGKKVAVRDLGGVNLVRRGANGQLESFHDHGGHGNAHGLTLPPSAPRDLLQFRDQVRAWVAADAARPTPARPASPQVRKTVPVKPAAKVKP